MKCIELNSKKFWSAYIMAFNVAWFQYSLSTTLFLPSMTSTHIRIPPPFLVARAVAWCDLRSNHFLKCIILYTIMTVMIVLNYQRRFVTIFAKILCTIICNHECSNRFSRLSGLTWLRGCTLKFVEGTRIPQTTSSGHIIMAVIMTNVYHGCRWYLCWSQPQTKVARCWRYVWLGYDIACLM